MDEFDGGLLVGLFAGFVAVILTWNAMIPRFSQYTYIRPLDSGYCVALNVSGADPDLRCNLSRDAAGKMSDAINALMGAPK